MPKVRRALLFLCRKRQTTHREQWLAAKKTEGLRRLRHGARPSLQHTLRSFFFSHRRERHERPL